MTIQIADAKTRYFNDKDHYIRFLKSWKRAANSVNCKATKDKFYGNKVPGWLTSAHMFLYAILRGKDASSAFTLITRESKLNAGMRPDQGMYDAYNDLKRLGGKWTSETRIAEFLAPFNGTIEKEVLLKIIEDLPEMSYRYEEAA